MLNERRQRVLHLLLSADQPLTAAAIGRTLNCPARSVRYDLETIGSWVKQHQARLNGVAGVGYELTGNLDAVRGALRSLTHADGPVYEYVLSPRERVRRLLLHLLGAGGVLSLQTLADRLGVGKSTVHSDLVPVETWAGSRGLTLDRSSAGLSVSGAEPLYRQAMADLIMEMADEGQLVMMLAGEAEGESLQALLRPMLPHVDWLALGATLHEVPVPELTAHLIVMVSRLKAGHALTYNPELIDRMMGSSAWQQAQRLAERVTATCQLELPSTERATLALLSQGARTVAEHQDPTSLSDEDLAAARSLAGMVEARLGLSLLDDQEFVLGLALHLRPIQYRLMRGLSVENPLLDEIRATYPAAFRAAEEVARVLSGMWRMGVPQAEVGYLAIHIAAAIERARVARRHELRALLVCGSGIGTAQLLANRMRARFPDVQVARVASAFRVKEALAAEPFHLVIATCQIPDCAIPVVRVTPLLTEEDLTRIRGVLASLHPTLQRGTVPMLEELLTAEMIALDVPAPGWEEAVRAAGALLVQAQRVENRYVDAMVDTAKRLGPYIVLGPGFALPHSRPESGVLRLGMSLVRLREPVIFGHPDNDPVDLVIALGAVDHETHLTALMQLSELLGNPEAIATLRSTSDVAVILKLVAEVSRVAQGSEAEKGGTE